MDVVYTYLLRAPGCSALSVACRHSPQAFLRGRRGSCEHRGCNVSTMLDGIVWETACMADS